MARPWGFDVIVGVHVEVHQIWSAAWSPSFSMNFSNLLSWLLRHALAWSYLLVRIWPSIIQLKEAGLRVLILREFKTRHRQTVSVDTSQVSCQLNIQTVIVEHVATKCWTFFLSRLDPASFTRLQMVFVCFDGWHAGNARTAFCEFPPLGQAQTSNCPSDAGWWVRCEDIRQVCTDHLPPDKSATHERVYLTHLWCGLKNTIRYQCTLRGFIWIGFCVHQVDFTIFRLHSTFGTRNTHPTRHWPTDVRVLRTKIPCGHVQARARILGSALLPPHTPLSPLTSLSSDPSNTPSPHLQRNSPIVGHVRIPYFESCFVNWGEAKIITSSEAFDSLCRRCSIMSM